MHVCLFMYVCLYASSYVIGAVCFTCHNTQILTGKSKSAKINFLCCLLPVVLTSAVIRRNALSLLLRSFSLSPLLPSIHFWTCSLN